MTADRIFSVEELVLINEQMLGRGMPITDDGIGYNKADFGACNNYFWGLSDAQVADLSKRLVKYCNTQLGINKDQMKKTAEYYASLVDGQDRTVGVSVNVTENGTLISFRYNELFVDTIKSQPKRQFDGETKQWIVPNCNALKTLEALGEVGADVENAIEYVSGHALIKQSETPKTDVLTKIDGDNALLKFDYNKDILDKIKEIDYKDRKWNPDYKFWAINKECLKSLMESLCDVANFKLVK